MNNEIFSKSDFDILMEKFANLDIEDKREEIIKSMKYIIGITSKLCELGEDHFEMLYNQEMGDLNKKNVSEEDFLDATYAYLHMIKSANYAYVNSVMKKMNSIYTENN